MTRRTLSTGLTFAGWILLSVTSFAQTTPWERVRFIEPGRKIEVRQQSGKAVTGKFEGMTDQGIQVRQDKNVVAIRQEEVRSVALVIGKSRSTKSAIGFGVTAGILGGIVGAACASKSGCGEDAWAALIGIPLYSAMVAGICALFPPHKEFVYKAEGAPQPAAVKPRRGFQKFRGYGQ